jgi:hypothetical protein
MSLRKTRLYGRLESIGKAALVANTRSVVINCDPSCGHQTTYTNRPAAHPFLGLGVVEFSYEPRRGSLRSLYLLNN